jgi:hypothetical protein
MVAVFDLERQQLQIMIKVGVEKEAYEADYARKKKAGVDN